MPLKAGLYRWEKQCRGDGPVPVAEETLEMPSGPVILTVAVLRPSVPHVTCTTTLTQLSGQGLPHVTGAHSNDMYQV